MIGEPDVVVNVTVAERTVDPVFAVADSVTEPSPNPEAGETVNQDWSDDTLHDWLDHNSTGMDPADEESTVHEYLSTVSVGLIVTPG